MVCTVPRSYNGVQVNVGTIDPGAPVDSGANGNYLMLPWDKEKNIRVLYDKVWRSESHLSGVLTNTGKECHLDHCHVSVRYIHRHGQIYASSQSLWPYSDSDEDQFACACFAL